MSATDTPGVTPADAQETPITAGPITVDPDVTALEGDTTQIIQESRRGWKTSEFAGAVLAVIADLGLEIHTKDKVLLSAIAIGYAIARGIAKNGVPHIENQ